MRGRAAAPPVAASLLIAMVVAGGCDSAVESPVPGTFLVEVVSETGPPGAALLTILGDALEVSRESGEVFHRTSPGRVRIAVVGADGEALRVRVRVADVSRTPTGSIEEVVSFANEPIPASLYSLVIRRLP